MKLKIILISFIAIIIFQRCANPVGPTGGDKDVTPPKITSIKISDVQNEKKITIIFDENINAKNSILLSPKQKQNKLNILKENKAISFTVPNTVNSIF